MLCITEEVQNFLMAHPDGDRELSYINIIIYVMVKLLKSGGLYTKSIEIWENKNVEDNNIWENFCQDLIA